MRRLTGGFYARLRMGLLAALALPLALGACSMSPEEQREQIEQQVLNHPTGGPTWRAIKRYFPQDFDAYVDSVQALPAGDKQDSEVVIANEARWFSAFLSRVQPVAFKAPAGELLRFRDAQRNMVVKIGEVSVEKCAQISNGEDLGLQDMGQAAEKASAEHNAAMIRAAAAGLRDPQSYPAASDADWVKLGDAMRSGGVSDRLLEVMEDESSFLAASADDRCKAGIGFQRALAEVSDELSVRLFVSANMP